MYNVVRQGQYTFLFSNSAHTGFIVPGINIVVWVTILKLSNRSDAGAEDFLAHLCSQGELLRSLFVRHPSLPLLTFYAARYSSLRYGYLVFAKLFLKWFCSFNVISVLM